MTPSKRRRNVAKGTAKQRELANLLIGHGWKVHVTRRTPRIIGRLPNGQPKWISGRNDIYGCVDIVAAKDGVCLWLDVTHESDRWKAEAEMAPLAPHLPGLLGVATYRDGRRNCFEIWDHTGKEQVGTVNGTGVYLPGRA